jgi:glutathione peroxidase
LDKRSKKIFKTAQGRFSPWLLALSLLPGVTHAKEPPMSQAPPQPICPAVLQHTFERLQDDTPQNLCQFAGNVVLVVNTASYCGFTRQYDGLEKLYERYKQQGLVILGFPSNDFGQQEPESNKKIADFCQNTYGVKFPMFAKSHVKGSNTNPLYQQLIQSTGKTPGWNFHKYLISRDGRQIQSYPSQIAPQSQTLTDAIEKMLKGTP